MNGIPSVAPVVVESREDLGRRSEYDELASLHLLFGHLTPGLSRMIRQVAANS